jgi:hypothetical protein
MVVAQQLKNNSMANSSEYKKHYEQFSQNVAFAVRTWHHHVHLNNRANEDSAILAALNKAPRYWLDQRYSAVQTTIIFLGKIFDKDGQIYKVYNIDKTISAVDTEKEHFKKEKLRKRKVESGGEFEGIDEYIKNASEFDSDDLSTIVAEVEKAKNIWERIRPLRDKIYAHNEMLSDEERKELYEAVKNSDLNDILQILLNVSDALWQAEFNGRKPDFSSNHTQPIEWAKKEIEELIGSLLHM